MKLVVSKVAGLMLLGAMALLSSEAGASPVVRANAVSACTPIGGTPQYSWDAVYNTNNSSSMSMECSLPVSIAAAEEEGEYAYFAFLYYTDPGSGSISCSFVVNDLDGDAVYTHGSAQTSSNGEGVLTWNLSGGYLGQPYAGCTLPGDGGGSSFGIQSFQVLYGPPE